MLIAVEGINGTGKTTQAQYLYGRLVEKFGDHRVYYMKFPEYGSSSGKLISRYLHGHLPLDAAAAASLFAINKYEARENLLRLLDSPDNVVIVDRYTLSNVAFQTAIYSREMHAGLCPDMEERRKFMQMVYNLEHDFYNMPRADITLLFDGPDAVIEAMLERRGLAGDIVDDHDRNTKLQSTARYFYRDALEKLSIPHYWFQISPYYAKSIEELYSVEELGDYVYATVKYFFLTQNFH